MPENTRQFWRVPCLPLAISLWLRGLPCRSHRYGCYRLLPEKKLRLGITVKSRTRISGTESSSVYIFREKTNDRRKLLDACKAFECVPWIAVYVECDEDADLFLTSLANYDKKYRSKEKRAVDAWIMTGIQKAKYALDREVRHMGIEFKA